jgi:hypothetical protein
MECGINQEIYHSMNTPRGFNILISGTSKWSARLINTRDTFRYGTPARTTAFVVNGDTLDEVLKVFESRLKEFIETHGIGDFYASDS